MTDSPEVIENLNLIRRMSHQSTSRMGRKGTPEGDAIIELNKLRSQLKLLRRLRYPRKRAFIIAFAKIGIVGQASRAAGISSQCAYNWRQSDPVFAELWDEALRMANDNLEAIAMRRAFQGSDRLLIFLLRGRKPEYQQRLSIEDATKNRVVMLPADGPWAALPLPEQSGTQPSSDPANAPPQAVAPESEE